MTERLIPQEASEAILRAVGEIEERVMTQFLETLPNTKLWPRSFGTEDIGG